VWLALPICVSAGANAAEKGLWVAPGAHAAPVGAGAWGDDGHYQVPTDLVLVGYSLEGGFAFSDSLILSLAGEYNLILDRSPEPPSPSLAMVGIAIPLRLRFFGIGSERGRFYAMVGLGYAALWDRTYQYPPVTTDGGALRSSGSLYELGVCYRFRFDDRVGLEVGILARAQGTSVSNGVRYYTDMTVSQAAIPVYVSLPLSL
jgi:hypothetical protein